MNRLLLLFKDSSGGIKTMNQFPLLEDFSIEAVTTFTSFAQLCPTIDTLTTLANAYSSSGKGNVSDTGFNLRSILDAQRWEKTDPVKINTEILFYTRTSSLRDVVQPLNNLLELHLPRVVDKKIKVPGLNASNVGSLSKELQDAKKDAKGVKTASPVKLEDIVSTENDFIFSLIIPRIIYLPNAFIYSIEPTYSKHTTESGGPLWAKARISFQGLGPALATNFRMGKNFMFTQFESGMLQLDDMNSETTTDFKPL